MIESLQLYLLSIIIWDFDLHDIEILIEFTSLFLVIIRLQIKQLFQIESDHGDNDEDLIQRGHASRPRVIHKSLADYDDHRLWCCTKFYREEISSLIRFFQHRQLGYTDN